MAYLFEMVKVHMQEGQGETFIILVRIGTRHCRHLRRRKASEKVEVERGDELIGHSKSL